MKRWNNIGESGAKYIAESVKELKNLQTLKLDLRYNYEFNLLLLLQFVTSVLLYLFNSQNLS